MPFTKHKMFKIIKICVALIAISITTNQLSIMDSNNCNNRPLDNTPISVKILQIINFTTSIVARISKRVKNDINKQLKRKRNKSMHTLNRNRFGNNKNKTHMKLLILNKGNSHFNTKCYDKPSRQ